MCNTRMACLLIAMLITIERSPGCEVFDVASDGTFPLVFRGQVASVQVDPDDASVVTDVAAPAFVADVERVANVRPLIHRVDELTAGRAVVVIGTLGASDLIAELVADGALDVSDLEGQWESFKIVQLSEYTEGVNLLVIVGSDRRGTAFGVFEVSRAIGVSPWYWWADVPIEPRESLHLRSEGTRHGPPSIKYRGIFLNDEDWGLQPWAAKTFESNVGDIGPKTYAAVFELLLRLKANYIWPAMHPSTRAFNFYPDNKLVAERYAIVMGSSHAEPMLRNNVDEWERDGKGEWNYDTNEANVLRYWESRVAENGRFDNVYTIGMRGIHDSAMLGGGGPRQRARTLERIFAQQREMLTRHTGRRAEEVPQVFVPYKEVLAIYRAGLKVPDDVSLMWVDDNYGYIRQLSNARERQRTGRSGVYYHLSYWGKPHDYLWLCTTPPALIWNEMTKAHTAGADFSWVVNVGDLKLAEIGMDWFLRLAWKLDEFGPQDIDRYLTDFCAENFGPLHAKATADLLQEFYVLNHIRKPEHMGWNRVHPNSPVAFTELSHWDHGDEAQRRIEAFDRIQLAAERISSRIHARYRDAFFELVLYPVRSAANMNRAVLYAEKSRYAALHELPVSATYARLAKAAYEQIESDAEFYNQAIQGGKWRNMIDTRPRDLPVFGPPAVCVTRGVGDAQFAVRVEGSGKLAVPDGNEERADLPLPVELHVAEAKVVMPMIETSTRHDSYLTWPQGDDERMQDAKGRGRALFPISVSRQGKYAIELEVNHPDDNSDSWFVVVDDRPPTLVNNEPTSGVFQWKRVDDVELSPGLHQLTIVAREDGAQLRRVRIVPANWPTGFSQRFATSTPNRFPVLNPFAQRRLFVDLYNRGAGTVEWQAESSDHWIKLSATEGDFEQHQRIFVEVDRDLLAASQATVGTVTLTGENARYLITLPVASIDAAVPEGTYIEENGFIAIDAEHYTRQRFAKGAAIGWRRIDGVGYSGGVVGLATDVVEPDLPLVPGRTAPSLEYEIHSVDGGEAIVTFQALPTQKINKKHALAIAFSIDGSEPQMVHFCQGDDEDDPIWQRNVLRGAMIGTARVALGKGRLRLTVFGIDPSVVLDRIIFSPGEGQPSSYLGPRTTRIGSIRRE